jgi:hypothetical protein
MSPQKRLEGAELLAKVAELSAASKSDKARACGYVTTLADNVERICFTAFYEACAMASGVSLEGEAPARRGSLSYRATVLTTGAVLIGPRYVEQIGLKPGDHVGLAISANSITIAQS